MKQIGMHGFAGKRVWVIGASSGIGEACAIALFAAGASVALSGRRLQNLQTVAQHAKPNQSLILPLDVTEPKAIQEAYQKLMQEWGQLDLLLFVSGIYIPLRADNFEMESAEKTINANVLGPMRAVVAVLPNMLERHSGHIAIGRRGDVSLLDEPFRAREVPSSRNPVSSIAFEGRFKL